MPLDLGSPTQPSVLIGIFVGGESSRFQHFPKGLLKTPRGQSLIEQLVEVCQSACPNDPIVLIGQQAAYGAFELEQLPDEPPGIGPIGGLRALLLRARAEQRMALALACDLPELVATVIGKLSGAPTQGAVVAPKSEGLWQPFCARYAPTAVLPVIDEQIAAARFSLMDLFEALGKRVVELTLDTIESATISDCDTPEIAAQLGLSRS